MLLKHGKEIRENKIKIMLRISGKWMRDWIQVKYDCRFLVNKLTHVDHNDKMTGEIFFLEMRLLNVKETLRIFTLRECSRDLYLRKLIINCKLATSRGSQFLVSFILIIQNVTKKKDNFVSIWRGHSPGIYQFKAKSAEETNSNSWPLEINLNECF